jgi:hypothetical protein
MTTHLTEVSPNEGSMLDWLIHLHIQNWRLEILDLEPEQIAYDCS